MATSGYSAGDCADSQRNQSGRQNPTPEPQGCGDGVWYGANQRAQDDGDRGEHQQPEVLHRGTLERREGVRLVDGAGNAEKSTERSGGEESMMFFVGVVVGIGVGILSVIVTLLAVADREERKK